MNKASSDQPFVSTFQIAATYIGTVVGAGFASGQEVLQFFAAFGAWGLFGVALATGLFLFFGFVILDLGRKLRAPSHLPLIRYAGGPVVGRVMDAVITFFLFGALTVMAAGSGAILTQEFGLPSLAGGLLMLMVTALTVLTGIKGVIQAISYVVPLLLVSVLGISLYTIAANPGAILASFSWSVPARMAAPHWLLAAILYASYNLVVAVAILAPLGALGERSQLRRGAIWGGLGLGLGMAAISGALIAKPRAVAYEVPMLFLAGGLSPALRAAYSAVLLAEVYTTAVGSLYGFATRLSDPQKPTFRWVVGGSCLGALVAAQFGFSQLVGVLFPLVGYAGLFLLVSLIYVTVRQRPLPISGKILVPAPVRKRGRGKNGT